MPLFLLLVLVLDVDEGPVVEAGEGQVQAGFGRTGEVLSFEAFDDIAVPAVVPDLDGEDALLRSVVLDELLDVVHGLEIFVQRLPGIPNLGIPWVGAFTSSRLGRGA
jgi:hypothetical protein